VLEAHHQCSLLASCKRACNSMEMCCGREVKELAVAGCLACCTLCSSGYAAQRRTGRQLAASSRRTLDPPARDPRSSHPRSRSHRLPAAAGSPNQQTPGGLVQTLASCACVRGDWRRVGWSAVRAWLVRSPPDREGNGGRGRWRVRTTQARAGGVASPGCVGAWEPPLVPVQLELWGARLHASRR